jgi:hypothetical protein
MLTDLSKLEVLVRRGRQIAAAIIVCCVIFFVFACRHTLPGMGGSLASLFLYRTCAGCDE